MPSSPPGYQDDDEPFLVGKSRTKNLRFWLLLGEGGGLNIPKHYSQRKLNTHTFWEVGVTAGCGREFDGKNIHSLELENLCFFEVPLKGLCLCFLNCTSSYLGSSMYSQKSSSLEMWRSTLITTQQIRSKWILACIAGSKPILRINFSDPKNNPFPTYCWITPAFWGSTNSQLSKPNTPTPWNLTWIITQNVWKDIHIPNHHVWYPCEISGVYILLRGKKKSIYQYSNLQPRSKITTTLVAPHLPSPDSINHH